MTKEEYIEALKELALDIRPGNDYEIIYQIDDLNIYGDFDYGIRGVDHNILKFDNISWDQILNYGTLVVPENQTYVSNVPHELFEELGYTRITKR